MIGPADEEELLAFVRELPFRVFEFHGYSGKRRVVSFRWDYDFAGRKLQKANDILDFLLALRPAVAAFTDLETEALQHVLGTEYRPRAGIGWYREKAVFGQVVGIPLLAPCVFRMRKAVSKKKWERVNLEKDSRR
jgi:alkylated DNA repair dioxygenase AlkB